MIEVVGEARTVHADTFQCCRSFGLDATQDPGAGVRCGVALGPEVSDEVAGRGSRSTEKGEASAADVLIPGRDCIVASGGHKRLCSGLVQR